MHIVSHDFRAPIRSIYSLSSWIYEDNIDKLNTEGVEQLKLMKSQAKKLNNMLDGLLRLSSIIQRKLNVEEIKLDYIIKTAMQNCEISENLIKVNSDLPKIYCDGYLMTLLFTELFKNAVAAYAPTDALKQIIVSCKAIEGYWLISIEDQGLGFNEVIRDRVFKSFQVNLDQQSEKTIGIGLSLAKKIIEKHNGQIKLSENLPKGTIVSITLPVQIQQSV
jgi:signal transduction histidine kinase